MAAKRRSSTDTTDSLIKLECVRRKNRRASITEQFVLPYAATNQQQRRLQSRHHQFLLQSDVAADINEIVSRVRALAEGDVATVGHALSPMDKHRFRTWAEDMIAILTESFEASDSFTNDPIWRVLEKLQFLQDGHVCLAEVTIEGHQLVQKWERAGLFDEDPDDAEEVEGKETDGQENADGGPTSPLQPPFPVDWETKKRRRVVQSYAYQRISERAASRVIKRNTLRWVRSRAAFCSRVEELEVFGNTTASLMTELTSSTRRAVAVASNGADFFDLMKGRWIGDMKRSIDFKELMQFSRHIALFTVDHALRHVEELAIKRRLYEARCILKLQTWWRRMQEIVKGRHMLQLLAGVKRKQDEEKAAREAELRAAKEKRAKSSKQATDLNAGGSNRKVGKPPPIKTTRSPSISATANSPRPTRIKNDASESERSLLGDPTSPGGGSRAGRCRDSKAFSPTPPSTPKVSGTMSKPAPNASAKKLTSSSASQSTADTKAEEKAARIARVARAKEARLRREFEEELQRRRREDEEAARDTDDVETAWKRFLESATNEAEKEGAQDGDAVADFAADADRLDLGADVDENESPADVAEWYAWSDDEDARSIFDRESLKSRQSTPRSTGSSRLSTPHSDAGSLSRRGAEIGGQESHTSRPMRPTRVVVKVKRSATERSPTKNTANDLSRCTAGTGSTTDMLSAVTQEEAPAPSTPAHPPSRRRLMLENLRSSESRKVVKVADRLSVVLPFGDPPPVSPEPPRPSPRHQHSTRRHLHEMEFHKPASPVDAAELYRFENIIDGDSFDLVALSNAAPELRIVEAVVTRPVSPMRMFASLRASRVARMHAAFHRNRKLGGVELEAEDDAIDALLKQPGTVDADEQETHRGVVDTATPITYKSEATIKKPESDLGLNTAPTNRRPIRGRASIIAAYISNPMLKLDFRKEDVIRASLAATKQDSTPQPLSQDNELSSKPKFGSHAEWLATMGLGDAIKMAARGPRPSMPASGCPTKSRAQQGAAQVALSVAAVLKGEVHRAQRKRKEEHALPLLGNSKQTQNRHVTKTKPMVYDVAHVPSLPRVRRLEDGSEFQPSTARRLTHSRGHNQEKSLSDDGTSVDDDEYRSAEASSGENESESHSDQGTSEDEGVDEDRGHLPDKLATGDASADENHPVMDEADFDDEAASSSDREATSPRSLKRRPRRPKRLRTELHVPRNVRDDVKPPAGQWQKRRARRARKRGSTADGDGDGRDTPSEDHVRRFRPRGPSLIQRLVPKESRWSVEALVAQRNAGCSDAEDGNADDDVGSIDSEAGSPTAISEKQRAEAFKNLFAQYMGLLHAAPTIS